MVRKSERNKSSSDKAATPSRKAPTRSSRRRKKSTSESEPEPDAPERTLAEEIPLQTQPEPAVEIGETSEAKEVRRGRGRPRRQQVEEPAPASEPQPTPTPTLVPVQEEQAKNEKERSEDQTFWESSKAGPSEQAVGSENSMWKIQSSNGSGGEIQKLKICRQRLTDSAESSSSPAKEIASPRRKRYRKRKGKDRLLEDGTESTGSHTDTEAPSSTVEEAVRRPADAPENNAVVESASQQEVLTEEIVTREAESAAAEQNDASSEQVDAEIAAAVKGIIVELGSDHDDEPERDFDEVQQEPNVQPEVEELPEQEPEEKAEEDSEEAKPGVEVVQEVDEPEEVIDKSEGTAVFEGNEETVIEQEMIVVESESTILEVEPSADIPVTVQPSTTDSSAFRETEDVEEGELEPKKPKRNLKLAVTNEDAMQQIAMKLNERAARFSKEATEEAARKSAPVKIAQPLIEEDEEEGEISRDPGSTKKLELKRLNDDDVEPNNQREERRRRPVSDALTTPVDGVPSKHDVSTEILKVLISDVVEPVAEEEVQSIFNPKESDLGVREAHSDNDSTVDIGDVGEEEGELVETGERRKSSDDRNSYSRTSSREDSKRTERRVTKETKESGKKTVKSDRKERRLSSDEPKAKKKYERSDKERDDRKHKSNEKIDKPEVPKSEENHKTIRKISIVSEDSNNIQRSVSPSTKKTSPVLFVTNLTRPFTIGQLKELLARTGSIAPNGFYIDKIKSKCFVKYADVEMAIETRHALHGVRWPITSPRTLRVDFSTDEAMEAVKKMAEEEDNAAKKQDLAAQHFDKAWLSEKDIIKPKKPKNLVREWDMGKDVSAAPVNDGSKKDQEEEWGKPKDKRGDKEDGGRRRQASPVTENIEPARKVKRREADAPAKLLDDLFRKTVATPCIYWLPLTASQIAVKEEMRRQHMAEHQKRLAEMKKSDSSRRDNDKSRERERERDRARDRRRK